MKNISISESTFKRLEAFAIGFDTPESVIVRLLDEVDGQPKQKPSIVFIGSDESCFKQNLLRYRIAEVCIYSNMTANPLYLVWDAKKLTDKSNLRANLSSGFLRDWRKKGITKIELKVLDNPDLKTLNVAHALGISYEDALLIQPQIHPEDKGKVCISFKNPNQEVFSKIPHKFTSDWDIFLPSYMFN